jgi:hypothetical protein
MATLVSIGEQGAEAQLVSADYRKFAQCEPATHGYLTAFREPQQVPKTGVIAILLATLSSGKRCRAGRGVGGVGNTAASAGRDGGEPLTETVAAVRGTGPQLAGVAAGVTGAVLVVAGVWGLQVLTSGGGVTGSVGWVLLLLAGVRGVG